MYIPEFWCGVAATILVEIGLLLGGAVICALIPSKKNKEDNHEFHQGE